MAKAIILDCWSTLFCSRLVVFLKEKLGVSERELIRKLEKSFMLTRYDNIAKPLNLLLEELGVKQSKEWVDNTKRELENILLSWQCFPETIKMLKTLKKDYKLGLITNTESFGFEKLEKECGLNEIFDVIIKSYDVGMLKPDPRIFQIMLKKLDVKPEDAIMVGDSLNSDILGAERCGITGVLIDREKKHPRYAKRIESLEQIERFL